MELVSSLLLEGLLVDVVCKFKNVVMARGPQWQTGRAQRRERKVLELRCELTPNSLKFAASIL